MIVMNENIVFLNIIKREGKFILKNESIYIYIYIYKNNISLKKQFLSCFLLGSV